MASLGNADINPIQHGLGKASPMETAARRYAQTREGNKNAAAAEAVTEVVLTRKPTSTGDPG